MSETRPVWSTQADLDATRAWLDGYTGTVRGHDVVSTARKALDATDAAQAMADAAEALVDALLFAPMSHKRHKVLERLVAALKAWHEAMGC